MKRGSKRNKKYLINLDFFFLIFAQICLIYWISIILDIDIILNSKGIFLLKIILEIFLNEFFIIEKNLKRFKFVVSKNYFIIYNCTFFPLSYEFIDKILKFLYEFFIELKKELFFDLLSLNE